MTNERYKGLVHRFFHNWQTGEFDDLLTADFTLVGSEPFTSGDFLETAAAWRQAFPNGRFTIHTVLADGPAVMAYWTFNGNHQGPWQDVAPTGDAVAIPGAAGFQIIDDRLRSGWLLIDRLQLWQQLGRVPRLNAGAVATPTAEGDLSLPVYLPESLRAKDDGFAFNIQNPKDDCTLISLPSLRINGAAISRDQITLITMNGGIRPATAVSAANPLPFPANTTLRFQVRRHLLSAGAHELTIDLELAETAIPHTIQTTDDLAV